MPGPLEDWTRGALRLKGTGQYAFIPNEELTKPFRYELSYAVDDWATVTFPAKMSPGQRHAIEVKLEGVPPGRKLHADLHWRKSDGSYAGFLVWGGPPKEVTGEGPYRFTFTPPDKPDLGHFVLTLFLSKTGAWEDRTRVATCDIAKGDAQGKTNTISIGAGRRTETRAAADARLKSPQIFHTNFLLEVFFRTAPEHTGGTLAEKMDRAGYRLAINARGGVTFSVAAPGIEAQVNSHGPVNDGQWHHVVAEADRQARLVTLYLDGRKDSTAKGIGPDVSLANPSDFYVGGTPRGGHLDGTIDFLRIAQGTLADARTTIEELYQWQFNGPFLRDFCGRKPVGKRDSGAVECTFD